MPVMRMSPELDRIVPPGQDLEILGTGFGAFGGPTEVGKGPAEGPLWWKEGGYLLFSDLAQSKQFKWTPDGSISVFREPTNHANGVTRDRQGRIVACEDYGGCRVIRLEPDGSTAVVASTYKGRRLNRPNDVVVKSDGSIYFTDPGAPDPSLDLEFSGVYRVSADLGTMTLLVRDFVLPNGLAFSPDESIMYIADSYRKHIRAFEVLPNGTLGLHTDRVFCEMNREEPGITDGMKVDSEGNVYSTGPGGVWIIDPNGTHLGTIVTGSFLTTNVGWGGDDWKTLFITTYHELARIRLKVPGVPVPG